MWSYRVQQSGKEVTSRAPPPPRTGRDGRPVIQLRLCAWSNPWLARERYGGTPGGVGRGCKARRCRHVPLPAVVQVQRFFIEQARLANRASPVLPGREGAFDWVCLVSELSPPARPFVPVVPQSRVQRRVCACY